MSDGLLSLIRERLDDWRAGKLSDYSCCISIGLLVMPIRPYTAEEIALGQKIEKRHEARIRSAQEDGTP